MTRCPPRLGVQTSEGETGLSEEGSDRTPWRDHRGPQRTFTPSIGKRRDPVQTPTPSLSGPVLTCLGAQPRSTGGGKWLQHAYATTSLLLRPKMASNRPAHSLAPPPPSAPRYARSSNPGGASGHMAKQGRVGKVAGHGVVSCQEARSRRPGSSSQRLLRTIIRGVTLADCIHLERCSTTTLRQPPHRHLNHRHLLRPPPCCCTAL